MAPVFAAYIFPSQNYPVDFDRTFFGARMFGAHKTFRGLISGMIAAIVVLKIQQWLFVQYSFFRQISVLDYTDVAWTIGGVMGIGALVGDLVKSFLKRRLHIKPGMPWFPFDQIDWILGSAFVIRFFIPVPSSLFFAMLVSGLGLHLSIKALGYLIGINEDLI